MSPQRIVCLTEETTEFLYLLGESHRVVGISAYTCRPAQAKKEKPVVSAFMGGSVKKIKALKPDLVIGFSDVQADLAQKLIRENLNVWITNQRSVSEILSTLMMLGRLVDAEKKAQTLIDGYQRRIEDIRQANQDSPRPRVYFEEWHDPMISAIEWVGELIEIAGGDNIFHKKSFGKASAERYVTAEEVCQLSPDVYIGCWCGKPVEMDEVRSRPGFATLPAFKNNQTYELDPAIILQPGPASLTDGLDALCKIINTARTYLE